MTDSPFTLMIQGKHPSFKIFEDEHTFAFLARESLNPCHTLIVPKVQVDYFIDLPEPHYSAVFRNAKIIAQAIQTVTNCRRVGMMSGGWDIPHFHYHLVPMFDFADLDPRKAVIRSKEENLAMQKKLVSEVDKARTDLPA